MGREAQEATLVKPILTENRAFHTIMVLVPESIYRPAMMPTADQAYEATELPQVRPEVWGGYLFAAPAPEAPEGYLGFYFAQPQTTEETNTAYKTWHGQEQYHWPRELELLKFYVVDQTWTTPTWDAHSTWTLSGVSAGSGETKLVRHSKIRESYSGKTLLKYELFLSRTAWSDTFLASDSIAAPVPGVVEWNLPGDKGREDDVLHGSVFIPRSYFDILQGNEQTTDFGVPPSGVPTAVTSIPPQTYAATNHTIWTTHTAQNEVKVRGYLYERLKITAYAPTRATIWT